MEMEDLAECDAEVIQPIKYEYKAKEGKDGVSLWEVSFSQLVICFEWEG
jgi:gamma-glutamyltranspeptidase/glutathione hydrolase